jgi:hypothetical protein
VGLAAVATAGTAATVAAPAASADPVSLQHAIIVCQSANFYDNVPSSGAHLPRILSYGNKVGHTRGRSSDLQGMGRNVRLRPQRLRLCPP